MNIKVALGIIGGTIVAGTGIAIAVKEIKKANRISDQLTEDLVEINNELDELVNSNNKIDEQISAFEESVEAIRDIANKVSSAKTDEDLNKELHEAMDELGVEDPLKGKTLDEVIESDTKITFTA